MYVDTNGVSPLAFYVYYFFIRYDFVRYQYSQ